MRKKILFSASTPMNYITFEPLYKALKKDPRLQLYFTAHHSPRKLYRDVGLKEKGLLWHSWAEWKKLDLCICPGYFLKPKRTDIKVQIFHNVSLQNYSVSSKALFFDKLFLAGPYIREKFISTGILEEDDPRLEAIGMPKCDCLLNETFNAQEIKGRLNLREGLPTVIYAPIRSYSSGSSLDLVGEGIIQALSQLNINFLIKLHDRSLKKWWKKVTIDWPQKLCQLEAERPNVRFIRDYSVYPYLFISDILVSDISSVTQEFCLLDRPIIFYDIPHLVEYADKKERERWGGEQSDLRVWGRQSGWVVKDVKGLIEAIHEAQQDPQRHSPIRKEFVRRFFYNPGTATSHAVDKIYQLLGLDNPRQEKAGAPSWKEQGR